MAFTSFDSSPFPGFSFPLQATQSFKIHYVSELQLIYAGVNGGSAVIEFLCKCANAGDRHVDIKRTK